jgi:hypothetical protein
MRHARDRPLDRFRLRFTEDGSIPPGMIAMYGLQACRLSRFRWRPANK